MQAETPNASVKVVKDAAGGPNDFVIEDIFGAHNQEVYNVVAEFPPGPTDPTLEVSVSQQTVDKVKAEATARGQCTTADNKKPDGPTPTPEPERPDLVVTKLTPGKKDEHGIAICDVTTTCRFQIAVTNTGGTYNGLLTIEDKITPPPGGAKPQSISIVGGPNRTDPRLTCQPPTDFNVSCTAPSIELKKGEVVSVIVEVVPGASWKNLDTALMENCGSITFDNKPTDNGSPPKHRDCKVVKLDPFDVKVAKTGGQSCQPGKECKFELDIFNPGNIPHDDPVTVTDKLTGTRRRAHRLADRGQRRRSLPLHSAADAGAVHMHRAHAARGGRAQQVQRRHPHPRRRADQRRVHQLRRRRRERCGGHARRHGRRLPYHQARAGCPRRQMSRGWTGDIRTIAPHRRSAAARTRRCRTRCKTP